ncbi:MAG: hypothetical protein M1827_007239 [Pycnora praestabilis]|nr:MAG: hypothetical protein M1827_007239 [Pycnora praestabilis]
MNTWRFFKSCFNNSFDTRDDDDDDDDDTTSYPRDSSNKSSTFFIKSGKYRHDQSSDSTLVPGANQEKSAGTRALRSGKVPASALQSTEAPLNIRTVGDNGNENDETARGAIRELYWGTDYGSLTWDWERRLIRYTVPEEDRRQKQESKDFLSRQQRWLENFMMEEDRIEDQDEGDMFGDGVPPIIKTSRTWTERSRALETSKSMKFTDLTSANGAIAQWKIFIRMDGKKSHERQYGDFPCEGAFPGSQPFSETPSKDSTSETESVEEAGKRAGVKVFNANIDEHSESKEERETKELKYYGQGLCKVLTAFSGTAMHMINENSRRRSKDSKKAHGPSETVEERSFEGDMYQSTKMRERKTYDLRTPRLDFLGNARKWERIAAQVVPQ